MHFASFPYAVLLATTFVLYWSASASRFLMAPRISRLRMLVLFAASYLFYGWWNPKYLLLMLGCSLFDYLMALRIDAAASARGRKAWLAFSVCSNLGVLALFKYYNFFTDELQAALLELTTRYDLGRLEPLLTTRLPRLDLLLPAGISFYTFQSMSYTIDVYRRELAPVKNPLDFCVFVAFFPQLVAGPIVRARQFLPQLQAPPELDPLAASRGLMLIALGLIKKVAIADFLAVNLVDRVFQSPTHYTSAELLCGVYGYAFQIYCDFSAYSDIAIGSALLFGLVLPRNFDAPDRAYDLQDFWRRWHISLSTWLRDYLYIPLGGSKRGRVATYRNLLLTMLLGGLWHGAAWTFVAWGLFHGLGLALTRAWRAIRPAPSGWQRAVGVLLTFHAVCLGWVFFRAPTLERAREVLAGLGEFSLGTANIAPALWGALFAGAATHLPARFSDTVLRGAARLPVVLQALVLVAVVLLVRYAATRQVVPFIYFQF